MAAPALDARAHDAPARPRWTGTADSLRAAVKDLIETFGPKYPQGAVYLERLEALKKAGARPGDPALEQLAAEALLANPLLDQLQLALVKRPHFGGHDGFFGYTSYVKRSPAELCVLESVRQGGPVRTLLRTETGCIRDPDVSFDGRRILFAYARDERDDYHLYEIQADGSGLRQLTTSPPYAGPEPTVRGTGCQDVEPCYLPSGEIAFTSTRYVRFVDCVDVEPVTTLFVMDGDGRRLRGISANHVHDWHPAVLGDGRLIYTRWEYTDRSQMWPHKLFVKNPDGSGTAAFYGSNSWWPVSMLHARAIPGSNRVICTLAGHHSGTDQTGEIGLIDRARGTEDAGGVVALFPPRQDRADLPRRSASQSHDPLHRALPAFRAVVHRLGLPAGAERFGLYLADFSGNLLLAPRGPAAGLPVGDAAGGQTAAAGDPAAGRLSAERRHGAAARRLSRGRHGRGAARDGQVAADRRLRRARYAGDRRAAPGRGPLGRALLPRQRLGRLVARQADPRHGAGPGRRLGGVPHPGRAPRLLPAPRRARPGRPVDAELGRGHAGRADHLHRLPRIAHRAAARGRGGGPGPGAGRSDPLVRPAAGLRLRPRGAAGPRSPLRPCHDAADQKGLDLRGDATNWFSLAYENLRPFVEPIGPQGSAGDGAAAVAGAAASRLVDLLLAGHEDVRLDPESLDRIITWIDLNVPYYDNTAITRPSRVPLGNAFTASGRAVIGDPKPLWDALGNDCRGCHAAGSPWSRRPRPARSPICPRRMRRPPINLTHPEESRILTAPLARAAGGLELCGKPVWTGRDAPAYQAALRVIQGWHDDLVAHPREDMPGSVPCPAYTATQSKRQAWLQIEAANRRQ